MTWLEIVLAVELLLTWVALARCDSRRHAIAWSFFWYILIPTIAWRSLRFAIKAWPKNVATRS